MDTRKIGRFIAENRKKQNMTQAQLAVKLGVTGKTVSRWENGNYMPDLSLLQPLAENLNITLNELLRGEHIANEHLAEKSEENLRQTVDYSRDKIQKKQNLIIFMVAVCMVVMLFAGYTAKRQRNMLYGVCDTAEQRRSRVLDSMQVVQGKDAVYWQDISIADCNFQVCMFATDKDVGAFAIENVNGKYMLSASTVTSPSYENLEKYYKDRSVLLFLGADFNPDRQKDVVVIWNATPSHIVVKFKEQIIEPVANVNGYNLWYYVTDNLRDTFDISYN